jgi:mono/diheme cytochrome c family protein
MTVTKSFTACLAVCLVSLGTGCTRKSVSAAGSAPTAYGSALVESSGGKQVGATGSPLPQPLVVQVNDDQGNAVPGASVSFHGPAGVSFDPPGGMTDSSGQLSTNVTLGALAGRYQLTAATITKEQKKVDLKVEEIALDYQRRLGQALDDKYCSRCHNPESTPERVSNFDNLSVKPHAFTEGDTLNKMSDADLLAIIGHGGPALGKSASMPPYGYTLSKTEVQALIAYIRTISDPPYQAPGMVYAEK